MNGVFPFAAWCPIVAVEVRKGTKEVSILFWRLLYISAHLRGILFFKCATTYLSRSLLGNSMKSSRSLRGQLTVS